MAYFLIKGYLEKNFSDFFTKMCVGACMSMHVSIFSGRNKKNIQKDFLVGKKKERKKKKRKNVAFFLRYIHTHTHAHTHTLFLGLLELCIYVLSIRIFLGSDYYQK